MQPNGESPAERERPLDEEPPAATTPATGCEATTEEADDPAEGPIPAADPDPPDEERDGTERADPDPPDEEWDGTERGSGVEPARPENDEHIPVGETPFPESDAPAPLPPPARDAEGNLVLRTGSAAVLIAVAAIAAAVVLIHLGMVFLHVAPPNTVSNKHSSAIDGYIYPEFEQNWKLFAPNPLQQNVAVQVRVETRTKDGNLTRGDWINLTAFDAEHIRGNLLPSHTAQNELRRAWDFFNGSHDSENKPTGPRGELSEAYVKRIAMLRLGQEKGVDTRSVQRLQLRSATTPVQPPSWTNETVEDETKYRTLPWWNVTDADVPEAVR